MGPIHNRNRRLAARLFFCFLLFASGAQAAANEARPAGEPVPLGAQLKVVPLKETAKAKRSGDAGSEARDPFSWSRKLMGQAERPAAPGRFGTDFTPLEPQSGGLPKMHLRGHVQGADGRSVALLEIEGGGVHMVREKDTVGLHDLGFDSAIRIKKITRLQVTVEAGSLGRLIIVH